MQLRFASLTGVGHSLLFTKQWQTLIQVAWDYLRTECYR